MISDKKNQAQESLDILIIDDEVDICQLLVLILRNKNLVTRCSNSLKDAREMLKFAAPRLVFLDNHLSDGLGIDFIEHIKTVCPETKIIMITAHNTISNRNTALDKGAVHFIGKPFTSDDILETVLNFL